MAERKCCQICGSKIHDYEQSEIFFNDLSYCKKCFETLLETDFEILYKTTKSGDLWDFSGLFKHKDSNKIFKIEKGTCAGPGNCGYYVGYNISEVNN